MLRDVVRGAALRACSRLGGSAPRRPQRADQIVVVLRRDPLPGVHRLDDVADAIDDREHRIDQPAIGGALAVAHLGQHILGGMAQPLEPGQIEEAAAALDGVDEAEDRVEPRAVGRDRIPTARFPRRARRASRASPR